jgi:hypothetical protein
MPSRQLSWDPNNAGRYKCLKMLDSCKDARKEITGNTKALSTARFVCISSDIYWLKVQACSKKTPQKKINDMCYATGDIRFNVRLLLLVNVGLIHQPSCRGLSSPPPIKSKNKNKNKKKKKKTKRLLC